MRLFGKIMATLLVLLALGVSMTLTLMHTHYATPIALQIINGFSPYSLAADRIDYHIDTPWQLTITHPALSVAEGQPPLTAQQLILWLNPVSLIQRHWQFDTILIDKPSLTNTQVSPFSLPEIRSQRLALRNLTVNLASLSLNNGKIELDNWHFQPTDPRPFWQQFDGDFRLTADSLNWQQLPFKTVLLDGEHHRDHWTLYGLSAKWQQASLNGQLEYNTNERHLTLHQLTLAGLKLQSDDMLAPVLDTLKQLEHTGFSATVSQLDILNSSIELPTASLNHASLSLENWHWPQSAFQQTKAWLSFNADSGIWHHTAFNDPLFDLAFTPQQIKINGASIKALEGYWRTDGTLTPDSLLIDNLAINGVKWLQSDNAEIPYPPAVDHLKQVTINNLDIGYTQLTAAKKSWPWQISGLNVSGHDLIIMQGGKPGLWQGSLTTSAYLASLNTIDLIEPLIQMQANQGHWQISQAIIPFKDGLLDAQGRLDLGADGIPWSVTAEGDSLPTRIFSQWLDLPLPVTGKMDLSAHASGLGQHQTSLAYSLDGTVSVTFRDTSLTTPVATLWQQWAMDADSEQEGVQQKQEGNQPPLSNTASLSQRVDLSPLMIHSDRGRIQLAPFSLTHADLTAVVKGKWDLAVPDEQQISVDATRDCQRLQRHWHVEHQTLSVSSCEG
ncbi:AsmA family protein [Photobacterium nomapromontoriensis]|uniref:AsmA family protein n=1 Tax=Photobacterium nomapromontoriensis TaxID=2910237 RepID=UPI003D0C5AB5